MDRVGDSGRWGEWFQAIGYERNGALIGGVVYNDLYACDISMSFAGEGNWLTRRFLRAMFAYPFLQLGVKRVTGHVAVDNEKSLRLAARLGGKREGLMREASPSGDVVFFGMLRSECRWV
jgi:RimJ/RimL family protein N-acetyltransferase